jgi:hypothetical protein
MTRTQISAILSAKGFNFGEWVSLEGFTYISSRSDKGNFIKPGKIEYYFDSDDDFFLTRFLEGDPKKNIDNDPVPEGQTEVFKDGFGWFFTISPGGIEHPTAGTFHVLTSFEAITGFHKKYF